MKTKRKTKVARWVSKFPAMDATAPRRLDTPTAIMVLGWENGKCLGMIRCPFVGYGAYPYSCAMSEKHPNAAIYYHERAGWTTEHSETYRVADKCHD